MDHSTNQPIVIDNGSGTLKAGFAGSDHPSCFFPAYVGTYFLLPLELCRAKNTSLGRPKHTRVMAGAVEGDTFIGSKAQELRGLLRIKLVELDFRI